MVNIDLNLLRAFDALFELRSVTRAAQRLYVTQSALSHTLGRLRTALADPLFIRGAHGLQPTARAMEIAAGIREGLLRLDSALAPSLFDPATAVRRFNIAASTYFCEQMIPVLVGRAQRQAPGLSFRIRPMGESLVADLDEGLVDVALGVFSNLPNRLVTELLYEEEMVWIAAPGSSLANEPMDPTEIAARKRVHIVAREPRNEVGLGGGSDQTMWQGAARMGADMPPREDATIVYELRAAVGIVARTDLIAPVPRRVVTGDVEQDRVRIIETTTPANRIGITMLWHSKQNRDPGMEWLRAMIHQVVPNS